MTFAKPRIQPLDTVESFRELAVWRRVVLYYLSDEQPHVDTLLVSSEAEREREVLTTRFPSAAQHGHQDAVDAVRAFAAITNTEGQALSSLLLFLGPSLLSQARTHEKGSVLGTNSSSNMRTGSRLKPQCCLKSCVS
jgi:hypothetical protein